MKITRWNGGIKGSHNGQLAELSWDSLATQLKAEGGRKFRGGEHHPGWSPGEFSGAGCDSDPPCTSHRAKSGVVAMYALGLDFDNTCSREAVLALVEGLRAIVHTTKSHKAASPHYRAVVSLDRTVNADEYERLWSWMQARAGGVLDKSTKDASRLWYIPSLPLSSDDAFELVQVAGEPLYVDGTLAIADADDEVIGNEADVAATDLPPEIEGAHADAFLARCVKGVARAKKGDRNRKLNSGTYMLFRHADAVRVLGAQRIRDAMHGAAIAVGLTESETRGTIASAERDGIKKQGTRGIPVSKQPGAEPRKAPAPGREWTELLDEGRDGPKPSLNNTYLVLHHDPLWRGVPAYNTLANRVDSIAPLPRIDGFEESRPGQWGEVDYSRLRVYCAREYKFEPKIDVTKAAVMAAASANRYDPFRRYLESLPAWDGTCRTNTIASALFSADQNTSADPCFGMWLLSIVARTFEPGCGADYAIVLVGRQDLGKSKGVAALIGDDYCGVMRASFDDRNDAARAIQGFVAVELPEFAPVRKSDKESVKAFVTTTSDSLNMKFRDETRVPRRAVFFGTANRAGNLFSDEEGRRWWPFLVHSEIDASRIREVRDQVWAETLARYRDDQKWWPSANGEGLMSAIVADRSDFLAQGNDVWEHAINDMVASGRLDAVGGFGSDDALHALGFATNADIKTADQARLTQVLEGAGFTKVRRRNKGHGTQTSGNGAQRRVWVAHEGPIGE